MQYQSIAYAMPETGKTILEQTDTSKTDNKNTIKDNQTQDESTTDKALTAPTDNANNTNITYNNDSTNEDTEFYCVFNTEAEEKKPANTLSFYYDSNKATHEGVTSKTVYDNLPKQATKADDWKYDDSRDAVKNTVIDESVKNYHELKSTAYMFSNMTNADNISGCDNLNVENVTDMSYMFQDYAFNSTSITAAPDVSNWNTANVTDMSSMFSGYALFSNSKLQPLDLSQWSINKLENAGSMFFS